MPTYPPARTGAEIVQLAVVEYAHLDAELRQRVVVRQQCLSAIAQLQRRFARAQTLPLAEATPEYRAIRDALRNTLLQYALSLGWSEADARTFFPS